MRPSTSDKYYYLYSLKLFMDKGYRRKLQLFPQPRLAQALLHHRAALWIGEHQKNRVRNPAVRQHAQQIVKGSACPVALPQRRRCRGQHHPGKFPTGVDGG